MPSRSSAPAAAPTLLFLAPPSDPSADDDFASYPDAPPVQTPTQRRRDTPAPRAAGGRDAARDGGRDGQQRRRGPGRVSGGRTTSAGGGPSAGPGAAGSDGAVRMTRGARRSATDFGITDAEVAGVLAAPARVAPEQDNPDRTRFSGGGLTVVTGADGTVLHVSRRRG